MENLKNDIKIQLEQIVYTLWDMSGADTITGALLLTNQTENVNRMLLALGLEINDLDIRTPKHCQDQTEEGWEKEEEVEDFTQSRYEITREREAYFH